MDAKRLACAHSSLILARHFPPLRRALELSGAWMRCQYKFKLNGQVKPNQNTDFEIDDYRFEFVLKDNLIDYIVVSFPVSHHDIPQVKESEIPGVNFSINIVHPRWEELETIMRQIEGMWSLWGVESIDISGHEIEWIPENELEKELIQLNNFQAGRHKFTPDEIEPIGFDLLVRPIITAVKDKNHDVVLSFYRRGTNDIKREEYIEAFYDFYFMLESHYGNGKTKNTAIEREMVSSSKLEVFINKILRDPKYVYSLPSELRAKYIAEYSLTSSEFIKKIVKLRGFLHHHNTKRKDGWDPGKQSAYKLEAFILQNICINVAMDILNNSVFSDRIVNEYKNLFSNKKL